MARDLDQEGRNKALVLEAFDVLFNRRHFAAAEKYFSPTYIQQSVGIAPGREGLFAEHWEVVQEEATKAESKSGLPMFGETFPQ